MTNTTGTERDDGTRVDATVRLDVGPLVDLIGKRLEVVYDPEAGEVPAVGLSIVARLAGVTKRTAGRWRDEGLSVWVADKAAARLGCHPYDVWGERWVEAITTDRT